MARTALVTGGNRGIGRAACERLAQLGLHVVIASRHREDGETVARQLRSQGRSASAVELDLTQASSIEQCAAELERQGHAVDVLVNNAGVYPPGDLFEARWEDLREAMEVHFFGPLALIRRLVPKMAERGYGRVVNVSSGYGSFAEGLEGPAAYALSKAALNALTLRLAEEVRGANVKVNALCPGWVQTRMGGPSAPRTPEQAAEEIAALATLGDDGPSGRFFRHGRAIAW